MKAAEGRGRQMKAEAGRCKFSAAGVARAGPFVLGYTPERNHTMRKETPYVAQMDEIIERKRADGMIGTRLFVDSSTDRTPEDVAEGYCSMEAAVAAGRFSDVTGDFL